MRSAVLLPLAAFLAAGPAAAQTLDYLKDVKPILSARCYACHGALRQKSGLRLDTAALIRKGGKGGPAVVPAKSDESPLIDAVTGTGRPRMPPEKEGAALTPEQIGKLRAWIDQGAKAPDEPTPEDPRNHWAFRVPVRPPIPPLSPPGRGVGGEGRLPGNPIDAFIAAEHEKRGLHPRPEADKATLLRRVYLDLIGLPPTRAELHAFLADETPDAYEKVVDRLLASPQYGERWGRHWMDVWRYSDWYGRRAVPDWWNSASQIWRWRDWIVQSLNRDKGYDCMVREMLAADEIAPDDDEAAVATGYVCRNWYALNPNQWMRDTVEHTGKAFLGLTFNCAHCHDHKYDPISNEEYFRFRAFFEPIDMRQDRIPGEPDPGPFQKYQYAVLRKVVKTGSIRIFDEHPEAKTFLYSGGDERNRIEGKPPVTPGAPAFLGGDGLTITPVSLPPTAYYPGLKPFVQQEETTARERAVAAAKAALVQAEQLQILATEQRETVAAQTVPGKPTEPRLADLRARTQDGPEFVKLAEAAVATAEADLASVKARIAADNVTYGRAPGNADELAQAASKAERFWAMHSAEERLLKAERTLAVAQRGGNAAATQQAQAQLASAKTALDAAHKDHEATKATYTPLSPVYPTTSTGRRKALAEWIASPENPLTARVVVNHIWGRHFGRPLVETVFDFGRNGKRPTHPELLDWLAVEFMESGWSMKHLHRLIVTSETYRMDSAVRSDRIHAVGEDPTNRVTTNEVADPDNRYLWHFPRRRVEAEVVRDGILHAAGELDLTLGGPELETAQEPASRRRSLYFAIHPEDGGHVKFLELFDAPDPCDCYRRTETLVPQQALAMTNSQLAVSESRLLARKLRAEVAAAKGDDAAFVVAAFEQVLTRRPNAEELAACLEFLGKQVQLFRGAVPPTADPGMRARESLVRALFNHNDFVTIR